jgi:hypothetical protein
MKLEWIKTDKCPHCGCTEVKRMEVYFSDKRWDNYNNDYIGDSGNSRGNRSSETMIFRCGYYVTSKGRNSEVYEWCKWSDGYKIHVERVLEDVKKVTKYLEENDIEEKLKKEILEKMKYHTIR